MSTTLGFHVVVCLGAGFPMLRVLELLNHSVGAVVLALSLFVPFAGAPMSKIETSQLGAVNVIVLVFSFPLAVSLVSFLTLLFAFRLFF